MTAGGGTWAPESTNSGSGVLLELEHDRARRLEDPTSPATASSAPSVRPEGNRLRGFMGSFVVESIRYFDPEYATEYAAEPPPRIPSNSACPADLPGPVPKFVSGMQ
jgi:hypothetical protein